MIKFWVLFAIFILCCCFYSTGLSYDPPENFDGWDSLESKIIADLKSTEIEDKLYGMKQVIHFGKRVNVCEAKYDILHVFFTSEHSGHRQLALMALYRVCDQKDLDILNYHVQFEQDPLIRKRLHAILNESQYLEPY
jgi:hypothetical protein